jgi:DnaJ family protein C protein 28
VSERSIEEEIKIKAQQSKKLARYMSSTEDLVEEQIRKARDRGDFDNLEGAGKPLDLSENPYEPADLRMAFRILKNNDFTPFWIQLGKDIDADTSRLWKDVEDFKRYTSQFISEKHVAITINRFKKKKASFYYEKRLELEKLKKKILDYNLQCPIFRLGRANIDVDEEMDKVILAIEKVLEGAKNL